MATYQFNVISLQLKIPESQNYFAGYEAGNTDITNENIRLLSKDMLSKVLIDEDEKYMISTGASLELKEDYELKIIQLDIDGDQAQIELMKDGKSVDTDIVTSPDDYVYTEDLGELGDVPLVVVHIDNVFAGTESDLLVINGIFQISDDPIPVDMGRDYGEMEIQSASGYTIRMENSDDIDLEEDEIVDIMGNLKFLVADNDTLRFALYEKITEPGTHDIRGTVYDTNDPPTTWDHMNFEGFYYNIDDDLGTETLYVKECSGSTIPEDKLIYETTAQPVEFDLSRWGSYNIVGFMAESYFAGYEKGVTDKDITNDNINLLSKDMLSKVLIDVEDKRMITTGASLRLLQLEEGYELKLLQIDIDEGQAQIELLKNGKSVDTEIVNSPDTYVYTKDLGKLDDVPIIVVYIDNVFAGTESDLLIIDGIFQISDDPISIDSGTEYGEMMITSASGDKITMKNPDDLILNEGGNTVIMCDIGFMTSDDGDRYCPFIRRTVDPIAALRIELPERLIVGEEIVITITADGDPVEATEVWFAGENLGLTDSNGDVRFTPDAAGTFMITASKANYNSASIAVRIIGSSTATADAMVALRLAVSGDWDADADVNGDGKVTSLDALMILQASTGAGAEQHVYPGAGTPIQDAIDDANPGDTIYVHAGEYCENVDVWKHVTLIGDGADVVTVRAADAEDHVFEVTTDWVNIRGFTATGATAHYIAGIYLDNADYCSISSNTVSDNFAGIYLYRSSNNTLANNTASDNSLYGIFVWHSSNNTITKNTVSSNKWDGIRMESSSNNTLTGNAMSGNRYNFGVSGGTHNIDTSNKVNEKPIYYWVNQQDKQIPRDAGYVGVVNSTNITVRDLTLANNRQGILFAYTSNSKIENITASNNCYGIGMYHSSNNTITNITASKNCHGIELSYSSNNNLLTSNSVSSNNYDGIHLRYSSNNTLTSNVMSRNRYNFGVSGSSLSHYTQNINTSNKVDEKPIYYWVNQHDKQIPRDAGYVGVVNSTNITIRDLTLANNRQGILFAHASNSKIENITASNNCYGIELSSSSNNNLNNNTVSSNNWGGIWMHYSSDNNLTNNIVDSNNHDGIYMSHSSSNNLNNNTISLNSDYGILLLSSSSNTLYHNNLAGNTNHDAYDTGSNQWDSGSIGNYYSNYTGTDNNSDGIGDDPYPIPSGSSVDRFPLMQPWTGTTSQKGDLNRDGVVTPAGDAIALQLAACGDEEVDIGGWVLENEDSTRYTIPEGTTIEPYGYYLTTKIQLDNGGGYVLLYRDGKEVDSSIAYTYSTEGLSWQRRIDGLDTDSDGDWIERDPTFGVPT